MDWIYAKVEQHKIKKICKDILDENLEDSGYKKCDDRKICLIPSFNSTIETELPRVGNSGFKINISGFRYYPNLENPMRIMLDLSDSSLIQLWQDELVDQIGLSSIHKEIEPPSVDIICAGKIGQERHFNINPNVRDNLIDRCEDYNYPDYIKIKEVTREILD